MSAKQNIAKLPDYCYSILNTTGELIKIVAGEMGYYPQRHFDYIRQQLKTMTPEQLANKFNEELGITEGQREAMEMGSLFGWEIPAANPDLYEERAMRIRESR